MIQSINIQNYQSHENTTIDFHAGINAIIGNSCSGKTAILRNLYWLMQNKGSIDSKISYWNRKKNGDPINPTQATIIIDDNSITRIKTKERNGYNVNDTQYSAIGKDIPKEVETLLNISDLNIATQHAPHFLLANSAGETARYLNSILKLDKIDTVMEKAESAKRKCVKDKETIQNEIISIEKQLNDYANIEQYAMILSSIDYLEKQVQEVSTKLLEAQEALANIETIESTTSKSKLILEASKPLIQRYEELSQEVMENDKVNKELVGILNEIQSLEKVQEQGKLLQDYKRLIADLEKLEKELQDSKIVYNELVVFRNQIMDCQKTIIENGIEIERLQGMLPEICPLCGKEICND